MVVTNLEFMRDCLCVGLLVIASGCQKSRSNADRYGDAIEHSGPAHSSTGWVTVLGGSPDLRQRADSLIALDPAKEALAAAIHGDLRYLAVCNRTECIPIGIAEDTVCQLRWCLFANPREVRTIEGTDRPVGDQDGARFNSVVALFGKRYNQVIREFRKNRPVPRPVT